MGIIEPSFRFPQNSRRFWPRIEIISVLHQIMAGFVGFTLGGFIGWMELLLAAVTFGIPVSMNVLGWAYENSGAPIPAGATNAVSETRHRWCCCLGNAGGRCSWSSPSTGRQRVIETERAFCLNC